MAYVKFKDIDDAKWLETYGDNFYIRNGKVYRRKKPKRPKVYSPWIQRIVETFKATGAAWQVTPSADRDIWTQYIPYAPDSISHYNAMLTCNVRARYPRIPALSTGPLGPRVPADSPHTPNGLAIEFLSPSNQLKIVWDPDYTELAYIQLFHFVLPGRRRHRPYWKYIASYYSGTGVAYITGTSLVAGHISMVTIRALNAYGEISAFAEPEEEEIEDAPVPLFTGTPTEGYAPLTVQFTDQSTGTIYDYLWEFGDGQYSLEQNPQHIYTQQTKYFHVTLNLSGPAESQPHLKKVNYIRTFTGVEAQLWLFVADNRNHRIFKRVKADLTYLDKYGSFGTDDDQFQDARGVCLDDTHFFTSDYDNDRITKRNIDDMSFVAKIGTEGSGDDQFLWPEMITIDDTHIYICDAGNNRIHKRLKSDLSFVAKIGTFGTGNDQFKTPAGICVDDTYLYICDRFNNRIVKRLKSTLAYVSKVGTSGTGNDQFKYPWGIACDGTFLYVVDNFNSRIVKRFKHDLTYVSKIGTKGSGDNQFYYPNGIAVDDDYLYISDGQNHRIKKHDKVTLAYISKLGSQGSGNNQFDNPMQTAVLTDFT